MKLVMILSRVPFPLEKGDKLRAYHQLRLLAQRHEVHLICLDDKTSNKEHLEHLRSIVSELYVFPLRRISILLQLIKGVFTKTPFQVHYFFHPNIARSIHLLLDEIKPDHVYCQLIRTAEYVKNRHDVPKTLDYMDALNAGMRRRLERAEGLKRILIREEAKRLVRYENIIFDYFEHHTIISQQDKELIYHKDRGLIHVVANGVDTDFFNPLISAERSFDIVFTGNMNYPPNVDGAIRLVKEIKPLVEKMGRKIKILLAGANPAQEVKDLVSIEGVEVTGWMDDIREAYAKAKLFVAPMRIGSGMQNKLLEAMSMAMPCITTPIAANAFSADQKKVLHIAETNQHIAEKIIFLLNDNQSAQKSGELSRSLVISDFNWSATIDQLEIIFNS